MRTIHLLEEHETWEVVGDFIEISSNNETKQIPFDRDKELVFFSRYGYPRNGKFGILYSMPL